MAIQKQKVEIITYQGPEENKTSILLTPISEYISTLEIYFSPAFIGKNYIIEGIQPQISGVVPPDSVAIVEINDEDLGKELSITCENITKNFCVKYIGINTIEFIVSENLNENDWDTIHTVAQAGIASSIWNVGDYKEITITDNQNQIGFNGQVYCYILGFNHNANMGEGFNLIHFAVGMIFENDSPLYVFLSQLMMNDTRSNIGGWMESKMRTVCCLNFFDCLSSDLQRNIVIVEKFSCSKDGGRITLSDIQLAPERIFLLSEFEIFESNRKSSIYEGERQQQYAFFSNQGSKIRYNFADTSRASAWWTRSVSQGNQTSFCAVQSTGVVSNLKSNQEEGFVPCFCI